MVLKGRGGGDCGHGHQLLFPPLGKRVCGGAGHHTHIQLELDTHFVRVLRQMQQVTTGRRGFAEKAAGERQPRALGRRTQGAGGEEGGGGGGRGDGARTRGAGKWGRGRSAASPQRGLGKARAVRSPSRRMCRGRARLLASGVGQEEVERRSRPEIDRRDGCHQQRPEKAAAPGTPHRAELSKRGGDLAKLFWICGRAGDGGRASAA